MTAESLHIPMEMRKFDNWLNHRQNNIEEGIIDKVRDFFTKKSAPTHTGPEEPSQVYTNPTVMKYTQEVISRLGIDKPLEQIDDAGKKIGDYPGHPPAEVSQTLMRFIAGHVLGGSRSFLNISYHDAAYILNFLDRLRVPGDRHSVAERLDVTNPNSLSHWLQNHVPLAPDALKQQGFDAISSGYLLPRKKAGGGVLRDARTMKLVNAAVKVINDVAKVNGTSRRMPLYLINSVKEMSDALEVMGAVVPSAGGTPPGGSPPPPPPPSGPGGRKPAARGRKTKP